LGFFDEGLQHRRWGLPVVPTRQSRCEKNARFPRQAQDWRKADGICIVEVRAHGGRYTVDWPVLHAEIQAAEMKPHQPIPTFSKTSKFPPDANRQD